MVPERPFIPGRGWAVAVLLGAASAACGETPRHRSTRPLFELESGSNGSPSPSPRNLVWDGESRPALDLPQGASARATIRPHPDGDSFELSVGILSDARDEAERVTLWVGLDTPQGLVDRRFDLEGSARWHSVLLPLTGRSSLARQVRLRTSGPSGAALAVSEPWLGQRADSAPALLLIGVRGGHVAEAGRLDEHFEHGLRADGRSAVPDSAAIERLARTFHAAGFRTFGLHCPAHGPAPAGFDRLEWPIGDSGVERAAERLAQGVVQAEGQALFVWVEACAEHAPPALEDLAGRFLADARLLRGVRAALSQPQGALWIDWPLAPSSVVASGAPQVADLLHTLLALGGVDPRAIVGLDLTRPWREPACACGTCAAEH